MNKFAGNPVGNTKNVGSSNTRIPRLGELLIAAKIIKPGVLDESLQIAKTSKTMIGRTLISLGQLDEHKLKTALDVQGLIRKGAISSQFGIKALSIACASTISIEEALQKLGWQPKNEDTSHENKLVSLMLESGLVNNQVLEIVEQQSKENNLPLGRCLVVNRHITQNRLEAVLCAQFLIKDNQITREQALIAIKISIKKRQPIESSLIEFGVRTLAESDMRLADLLNLAGLISDVGKLTALENALTENIPLGAVLMETKMLPFELVEQAINLQSQIFSGLLGLRQAANILKRCQLEGKTIEDLIAESQAQGAAVNQIEQMLDLLIASKFLRQEDITKASEIAASESQRLGEVLLSKHDISQAYIATAWEAQKMLDDRLINLEYACKTLRQFIDPNADTRQASPQAPPIPNSNYSDAPTPEPKGFIKKLFEKIFKK